MIATHFQFSLLFEIGWLFYAADSNALAARSYEGTEQLRNLLKVLNSYEIYLQIRASPLYYDNVF